MEERKFEGFTGKSVIFLLFLVAMILFFYLIGNYQNFLDETQKLLLKIERTITILLAVCLVFAGFTHITKVGRKPGNKIIVLVIFLILAALAMLLSLSVTFMLIWIEPAG